MIVRELMVDGPVDGARTCTRHLSFAFSGVTVKQVPASEHGGTSSDFDNS